MKSRVGKAQHLQRPQARKELYMEKSLLVLLREEDVCVANRNSYKFGMDFWLEASEKSASDGDEKMAQWYAEKSKEYALLMADAEKPLAVARAALRKYALEILKAETV